MKRRAQAEKVMAIQEAERKEGSRWEGWFEIIVAVMLGLATLASAWSAYQSGRWNGIQTFCLAESNAAARRAAEKAVFANQLRTLDAVMFERYVSAFSEKNQPLAEFLLQRFRPELQVATVAWLATRPWENPQAPLTPFALDKYSLPVEKEVQQWREEEAKKVAEARRANEIADTYLLLTVLYSVVLFLSGITATFKRRNPQVVVLALGVITMTAAAIAMALLPLAAE